MADTLTLALWAMDMAAAPRSREGFLAGAEAAMARARDAGADLLAMPEYACEAWLPYAPPGLPETAEVAWMAEEAAAVLPALGERARALRLALLAGTAPAPVGPGRYRNRAALFLPDGRAHLQDKLALTPDERDPRAWTLEPGDRWAPVEWRGFRLGVAVCLDVEQPALAARLQPLDLDLLLVPTDTGLLSGHSRVFACAKARAVELFCAVAAVGGVGTVPVPPDRPNVSGAAVYLPCEAALGFTGTLLDTGPRDRGAGLADLVIARDVPLGRVREARRRGGEVWPGPWSAARVAIGGEPPPDGRPRA